tara:strand:+ start:197 stop:457 length:261 start_codon:yes stop_codon:yes gene_type:complete
MEKEVEYLSLYDFLGKAAGSVLGKAVSAEAVKMGVGWRHKEVPHSGYEGKVMTYPTNFLKEYFHKEDPKDNISTYDSNKENDDLPF